MNDFRTEMRSWLSNPVTDAVADAIVNLLVTAKKRATTARDNRNRAKYEQWERDIATHHTKFGYTVRELREMPYDEYLGTDHWQRTRREALKRANYHCQDCRSRIRMAVRLEVHHLTYDRRGCERQSDLRVLCAACHQKEHKENAQ